MPELPEVEVVKRSLEKNILKLTIKKVLINTNKLRYRIKPSQFYKINKKKILSITRRSKYLLINLEDDLTIIAHLGMTGKFLIQNKAKQIKKTSFYYSADNKDKKHDHIIFILSKNFKLIYNDIRKFGFLKIIKSSNLNDISHLKVLGPEPFSNSFNNHYFKRFRLNKRKKIKDLLMDQKFVSGLGNIYVNEILFKSGVNPNKNIQKLKDFEITKIILNTKKILKRAIKMGGSSIINFKSSDGKQGGYQQRFSVYARNGKKCHNISCKNLIIKTVISGRSTFYCKKCQK